MGKALAKHTRVEFCLAAGKLGHHVTLSLPHGDVIGLLVVMAVIALCQ